MRRRQTPLFLFLFLVAGLFAFPAAAETAQCCVLSFGGPPDSSSCTIVERESGNVLSDPLSCSALKQGEYEGNQVSYIDENGDNIFNSEEETTLDDVHFVAANLFGAFANDHIGTIEGSDNSVCGFFDFTDINSVEYADTDELCVAGIAKFSSIDEIEAPVLHSLYDKVLGKLKAPLSGTCCIPKTAGQGLTCHAPQANKTFLTILQGVIVNGFHETQFNFLDIRNWWTCAENGFENLGTKQSKNFGTGSSGVFFDGPGEFYLVDNACNNVTNGLLPQEIVDQLEANPNKSTGIKFTTNYWCSVKDESFIKYCACNSDTTECHKEFLYTEEECDKTLQSLGSDYLKCTTISPADDFLKDIKSCQELIEKKDESAYQSIGFTLPDGSQLNKLGTTSAPTLIGRIAKFITAFLGSVALVIFIYGGFLMMSAGGNAERQKKALLTLVWGALGVIMVLGSWALATFLVTAI